MKRLAIAVRVVRNEIRQELIHHRWRRRGIIIDDTSAITGKTVAYGCDITIGPGSIVQSSELDGRGGLRIGSHAMVIHARIITAQHNIDDPNFPTMYAPVAIGDYAVIFTDAIIMPGRTVGNGAVVGAGSVVTKDVPELAVVAGNPARFIRFREEVHGQVDLRRGNGLLSRGGIRQWLRRQRP